MLYKCSVFTGCIIVTAVCNVILKELVKQLGNMFTYKIIWLDERGYFPRLHMIILHLTVIIDMKTFFL